MRKLPVILIGLVVAVPAIWTGAWFYGKSRIVQEIETQAQAVRDRGGAVAYDAIEVAGFPFGYTTRLVAPEATLVQETPSPVPDETFTTTYDWAAPWVEARMAVTAPRTVTITVPETQDLIVAVPAAGELPAQTIPMTVLSDGMMIEATLEGEDVLFDVDARIVTLSTIGMTGVPGLSGATYTMRDLSGSGRVRENAKGAAPAMLTRGSYTIGGFESEAVLTEDGMMAGGRVTARGGAMRSDVDWFGMQAAGSASLSDLTISVALPMLGDAPLDIGVAAIDLQSRLPHSAAPEPQDFAYAIEIDTVTLSEGLWALLDPQSAFPREIDALSIDLSGDAVFNVSLSDPDSFMTVAPDEFPVEVRTLSLNDLTVDALGLSAAGTGTGDLSGAVPEGTATLAVEGFPGFMNSLVKSGRMPPQQAMVVQLMVESFGKMEADGKTIRFDFEARDGMMYVNTIPVGEAPTMQ